MSQQQPSIRVRRITNEEVQAAIEDAACMCQEVTERARLADDSLFRFGRDCPVLEAVKSFDRFGEWVPPLDLAEMIIQGYGLDERAAVDLRRMMKKPKLKTMGDLYDFLAANGRAPVVEPEGPPDARVWEPGIFSALRAMLAQAGADVLDLTASSELRPFLDIRHRAVFAFGLPLIAQGTLPGRLVERYTRPVAVLRAVCILVLLAGLATCALSIFFAFRSGGSLGHLPTLLGGLAGFCAGAITLSRLKPTEVRLGQAVTFHDLCQSLAIPYYRQDQSDAERLLPSD